MTVRARRRLACRLALLVILVVAGCSPTPSPVTGPPTPAPAFGLTWAQIEDVERPRDAFALPSDLPTGPSGPDTAGHPGHFPGQSIPVDVAAQGDLLVAVGYTFIAGAWTADSWRSTDALHWTLAPLDERPGSFAESVVALPGGGFAAVGRVGSAPAAWTSRDGQSWVPAVVGRLAAGGRVGEPERMAVVIASPAGLLAGGSAGPELGDRRARLWSSADGSTWTPIADDDAFEGGEIVAIGRGLAAPGSGGFVALGRLGTGPRPTGSVAWVSDAGATWRRSDDPALADGLVAAVLARGDGGWLAVGSDGDEREAVAWTSSDGIEWLRAPREDSRLHVGEKIRMTDVVATSVGYVGIGNFVGVQFGEGTSWVSTDGLAWQRAPVQASLGQGEPQAIVIWRDRLVVVGSRGAPDNYIPTAWLSPSAP